MEVTLHVGVHKTATTYLQAVLQASEAAMRRAGVGYVSVDQIRAAILPHIRRRPGMDRLRLRANVGKLIDERRDCERLLLSDENILGGAKELTNHSYYFLGGFRTGLLARQFRNANVQVMIAVRSYDSYASSLYTEYLRHWEYMTPGQFVSEAHIERLNWSKIVSMLCEKFGAHNVTLWKYEDFQRVEDQVLLAMTGGRAVDWSKPRQKVWSSFSQEAVDALASLAQELTPAEVTKLVQPVTEKFRETATHPFRAFDEQTAARLREQYESDLASLEQRFPQMRVIRPASNAKTI